MHTQQTQQGKTHARREGPVFRYLEAPLGVVGLQGAEEGEGALPPAVVLYGDGVVLYGVVQWAIGSRKRNMTQHYYMCIHTARWTTI